MACSSSILANEISSHDFYLAERGSLIASFNRSFNVGKKNAKKVSKVLLQSLLEKMELLNQNGTPVATAQEHHQGYQVINTSQPEGDYVVRVCQTNVHDGNRFDMGFAVSQRLEASVWNQ